MSLGPTHPPIQSVRKEVSSPEVKRPGRDADHHSSSSPLICLRGVGRNYSNITRPRVLCEKKRNTQALNAEIKQRNQEELHTAGGEVKEKDVLEYL